MVTTITDSTFSQMYKIGNNGINANFVFPYIPSFLHYNSITFQGCTLNSSRSF